MNSPNPYSEDELDQLVRGALQARVDRQEPPDRVWGQIRLELEAQRPPPPRRMQMSWPALAAQAALTLLLVVVGGVGLQTLLSPVEFRLASGDILPTETTAYVTKQSEAPAVAMLQDKAELRLLKTQWKPRPVSQPKTEPDSHPVDSRARDVPPNVLSPDGRALMAELSSPLVVEEQDMLRSGPYPWYR